MFMSEDMSDTITGFVHLLLIVISRFIKKIWNIDSLKNIPQINQLLNDPLTNVDKTHFFSGAILQKFGKNKFSGWTKC